MNLADTVATRTAKRVKIKKLLWLIFAFGVIYTLVIAVRSFNYYSHNLSQLSSNVEKEPLLYPFDTAFCLQACSKMKHEVAVKDENGVYMVDFSKVKNLRGDNSKVYFPSTISLYALAHHIRYHRYQSQNDYDLFINNSNWFVDNISAQGCWHFTVTLRLSNGQPVEPPWCSALGQGLGMSTLVRAYKETGEARYLDSALKALAPFSLESPQSVSLKLDGDFVFYEELPGGEASAHIFNGHMYALIGLFELYQVSGSGEAGKYYEQGLKSLLHYLPAFDSGNWSFYSMDSIANLKNHWRYSSPTYQRTHTNLLQALYELTGNAVLEQEYLKYQRYLETSWVNLVVIPAYLVYQDLSLVLLKVKFW